MAVESAADRLAMLDDFGIAYTVNGTSYKGIFDAEFVQVDAGDYTAVTSQGCAIHVRTNDVAAYVDSETGQWAADSTLVTVDSDVVTGDWSTQTGGYGLGAQGNDYKVVDVQSDGTGMSTLILELQ